jgi:hypothetical protein
MTLPQNLETRVLALERRCRRQSLGLAGFGATILTACLAAAVSPEPGVVQAREFVLLGPNGEELGGWGGDENATGLWLQGAAGTSNLLLSATRVGVDGERARPWAGLKGWTTKGDEESASVVLGTPVGDLPLGLQLEQGDGVADIIVTSKGVAMTLEGGEETHSQVNLQAMEIGARINACYDNERTVSLDSNDMGSSLILSKDSTELDEQDQPIVELRATDAGSIRVHDGDRVIFEKP